LIARVAPRPGERRLGHGSIRTTFDTYGHLFDGHDIEQLDDPAGAIHEALVPKLCPPSALVVLVETTQGAG